MVRSGRLESPWTVDAILSKAMISGTRTSDWRLLVLGLILVHTASGDQ